MKSFLTIVAGNTLGAHRTFVKKLIAIGYTEVTSHRSYDYIVVFCPIVSRVGTDISEAMGKIPDGKPVILVVMHHTINPDGFVSDSSRHATKQDIILTVDCLFHESVFLDCNRNEKAFSDVKRVLGVIKVPGQLSLWGYILNCLRNKYFVQFALLTLAVSGITFSFRYIARYIPVGYPFLDYFWWTGDQREPTIPGTRALW